jgi:hypothetical protein
MVALIVIIPTDTLYFVLALFIGLRMLVTDLEVLQPSVTMAVGQMILLTLMEFGSRSSSLSGITSRISCPCGIFIRVKNMSLVTYWVEKLRILRRSAGPAYWLSQIHSLADPRMRTEYHQVRYWGSKRGKRR